MDVGNDAASGYANTSLNADPAELVPPRADATRLPAAAIPLRCSAAPTAFSRLPLPLHARVMLVPAGQAQKNGKVTESQRAKIRGSTRVSCKEQGAVRPPLLSPAPPLTVSRAGLRGSGRVHTACGYRRGFLGCSARRGRATRPSCPQRLSRGKGNRRGLGQLARCGARARGRSLARARQAMQQATCCVSPHGA